MPFSTNQIVWAKPRTEDWQPAFVIDVANDIWSFWSGPIEQSRIGYRHVFIIDSKSIELVNEENSIRDFCLGYAESYQSVVVGSDAMKALPLLVQMAAILSGEEIYPGQDWDWQIWAINFIRNCEPIRVSKKFYEKFTKKSRGQISPTIRNSSSMSPETIVIPSVSDDAVVTEKPAPVLTRCVGARKTIRSTGEKSPPKMPETDNIAIFEPESCYNSETKSTLRASQLVWAFRSGGLKERWWPAVVIEMPTGGSRTAIVSALNKTFDLFCARVTQIEDFCKSFNARVNRVDLKDPEERGNYKYAVRKAVEYVQEAIGGVNCEEDQWLHWALQNVAPYGIGGSVGLGAAQWNNILARTQNQLVQLKRREFGPDQRVSSSEPLHADSAALKGGREKYTSPEQVKKRSDMETIFGSKLMDTYHAVSDMDQLADESSADHKSRKKRKRDDDLNAAKWSPTSKAQKSQQSPRTNEKFRHMMMRSLSTPEEEMRALGMEKEHNKLMAVEANSSPASETYSPSKRGGRRSSTSTDIRSLLLPLDAGWLRQITLRKSGEKGASDVYYYFPKGIAFKGSKCRSGREVQALLSDNRSHPACRGFDARVHFSFNGNLTTGHVREMLHTAGDKISADLKAAVR